MITILGKLIRAPLAVLFGISNTSDLPTRPTMNMSTKEDDKEPEEVNVVVTGFAVGRQSFP